MEKTTRAKPPQVEVDPKMTTPSELDANEASEPNFSLDDEDYDIEDKAQETISLQRGVLDDVQDMITGNTTNETPGYNENLNPRGELRAKRGRTASPPDGTVVLYKSKPSEPAGKKPKLNEKIKEQPTPLHLLDNIPMLLDTKSENTRDTIMEDRLKLIEELKNEAIELRDLQKMPRKQDEY